MKKIMVAIAGFVAIASIFLVLFFGVLPFTKDKDIYCDYILMNMQNIMHDDEVIAEVLKRPATEEIKVGDDWFDNNYNYRIRIKNTNYLFDSCEGKINLSCEARTNIAGKLVSDPKLIYSCDEPTDYTTYTDDSVLQNGIIKFKKEAFVVSESTTPIPFTYHAVSHDAHKQSINIRIQVARLK